MQDRGNTIFTLQEQNKFDLLSNIEITIYYLNPYSKAYFTKQTGIRSYQFGSIYLFINGFRIPPYGDDWLDMEARKGQGQKRYLGTREVIGRIEINDNNDFFKIISNRSGVENNSSFEQLTKSSSPFGFYYKTFRRLERFVVEGITWDSTPFKGSEIEEKINDKNWNESKEIYNEDSLSRNKRILRIIHNIIDSKKDEIIGLNIDEVFVKQIIEEQIEKSKLEFERVIKTIGSKSKDLSPEIITDILNKISENSDELKNFSNIISSYSEISEKEIKGLYLVQDSLQKKYNELLKKKEILEVNLKLKEENLKKDVLTDNKIDILKVISEFKKKYSGQSFQLAAFDWDLSDETIDGVELIRQFTHYKVLKNTPKLLYSGLLEEKLFEKIKFFKKGKIKSDDLKNHIMTLIKTDVKNFVKRENYEQDIIAQLIKTDETLDLIIEEELNKFPEVKFSNKFISGNFHQKTFKELSKILEDDDMLRNKFKKEIIEQVIAYLVERI